MVEPGEMFSEYQGLLQGQIRVVTLLRSSVATDFVECTIENVTLEDAEKLGFRALSWSWSESPGLRRCINVNSKPFLVPPNLYNALLELRKAEEEKDRRLWIDCICINQKDTDEKAVQVPLMSKIYGQATDVIAWLGNADAHSKLVMATIRNKDVQGFEQEEFYVAMTHLCKRLWFTRVWILQEFAIPRKEPLLYCGELAVEWKDFQEAREKAYKEEGASLKELAQKVTDMTGDGNYIQVSREMYGKISEILSEHGNLLTRYMEGASPNLDKGRIDDDDGGYVNGLILLRGQYRTGGDGTHSLAEVLRASSRSESTDQRDRIYGLLGLLHYEQRKRFEDEVGIDYDDPDRERTLHRRAMMWMFLNGDAKVLQLYSFFALKSADKDAPPDEPADLDKSAPSWVPMLGRGRLWQRRPFAQSMHWDRRDRPSFCDDDTVPVTKRLDLGIINEMHPFGAEATVKEGLGGLGIAFKIATAAVEYIMSTSGHHPAPRFSDLMIRRFYYIGSVMDAFKRINEITDTECISDEAWHLLLGEDLMANALAQDHPKSPIEQYRELEQDYKVITKWWNIVNVPWKA